MKLPLRKWSGRLNHDQRGATAVEYGLIVSLIVVGIVTAISALGSGVFGLWTGIVTKITAVT